MKFFIIICLLVVVIGPCARAKSFNFGNIFFGSSKKALEDTESAVPRSASESNVYESNPPDYSADDIDSDVFNTSSDDIFDYDYQNSSADSLEISGRNESDDIPAIFDNKTAEVETVQSNETHSSDKTETTTASVSSTVTSEKTSTRAESASTAGVSKESPNTTVTEQEEVVLGTTGPTVVLIPKTFFQKSIDWVEDAYTLSILIPITAGILFATAIIVVIAFYRCLRRCCRRRRFRRKPLPDSVKNLRPSDRKRLLGDTSDEEF